MSSRSKTAAHVLGLIGGCLLLLALYVLSIGPVALLVTSGRIPLQSTREY